MIVQNKILSDFLIKKCGDGERMFLRCKDDGIHMYSVNPQMTMLMYAFLNKEAISNYKPMEGKISISNPVRFDKVLGILSNSGSTTINMSNDSVELDTGSEVHKFLLIDEESIDDEKDMSNLDYSDGITFTIKKNYFDRMIKNLQTFGNKLEAVVFNITDDKFQYYAEQDKENVKCHPIKIKNDNKNMTFSIEADTSYIGQITKLISTDNVKVSLKEDYPLWFREELGQFIKVDYILAPRNREDSDEESSDENQEEDVNGNE